MLPVKNSRAALLNRRASQFPKGLAAYELSPQRVSDTAARSQKKALLSVLSEIYAKPVTLLLCAGDYWQRNCSW